MYSFFALKDKARLKPVLLLPKFNILVVSAVSKSMLLSLFSKRKSLILHCISSNFMILSFLVVLDVLKMVGSCLIFFLVTLFFLALLTMSIFLSLIYFGFFLQISILNFFRLKICDNVSIQDDWYSLSQSSSSPVFLSDNSEKIPGIWKLLELL